MNLPDVCLILKCAESCFNRVLDPSQGVTNNKHPQTPVNDVVYHTCYLIVDEKSVCEGLFALIIKNDADVHNSKAKQA